MAVDLTVAAVPMYFGTMEIERRWLRRRAETVGATSNDYTKDDTIGSLSMGVGSLVLPLAAHTLARHVTPGKGRYAKHLLGLFAGAAAITVVADRLATDDEHPAPDVVPASRRRTVRRWARKVARVSGPTTIAAGVLAAATASKHLLDANRQWAAKGKDRDLGGGVVGWTAALAGWDFIYYWNHRMWHETRVGWAMHVVHHSSERYNLSTALRQPVADVMAFTIPYGILSRFGVRPSLIMQARGINLLYQYWIHTDAIRSIGPGEAVLNSASHHRVHHGSNPQYLDRNHGSILIVWDKLFGTFEPEDEPVVYGLTKNIESFNPLTIATHEHRDIVRDLADSTTWRDRLGFVFRGPGWAYRRRAELDAVAEAEAIVADTASEKTGV